MRRQETLTSTVVAVAQFSSFPPNSLESRQVSGSDVMARPVSLETETPSAPFLKGGGLGFPEKLPIRTWKPEARLGLVQRRASRCAWDGSGYGAGRLPLSLSESWGCQLLSQGGCGERVEGRRDQPRCMPGQHPRSPKYRGKKGNG